jgi:predicted RNA-binding protein with PUA-like domain
MARRYWLMKSEPDVFGLADLRASPDGTNMWDGVRNYQARNLLRDEIQVGDGVLFYHSRVSPPAVVGVAKVVRAGYPDPTQFDPTEKYHDPASKKDDPRWFAVDVKFQRELKHPVTLPEIREAPGLENMVLVRKSRLSVQPVTADEWKIVLEMGKRKRS